MKKGLAIGVVVPVLVLLSSAGAILHVSSLVAVTGDTANEEVLVLQRLQSGEFNAGDAGPLLTRLLEARQEQRDINNSTRDVLRALALLLAGATIWMACGAYVISKKGIGKKSQASIVP